MVVAGVGLGQTPSTLFINNAIGRKLCMANLPGADARLDAHAGHCTLSCSRLITLLILDLCLRVWS